MVNPSFDRHIGVLLHPTSLPLTPVSGTFGAPARKWLKKLSKNGIRTWQFLPLSPPDSTGSPYSSPSSFALNPSLLDIYDLIEEGFLPDSLLNELPGENQKENSLVDFSLTEKRTQVVGRVLRTEWSKQPTNRHFAFNRWCKKQFWLEEHASFMELRRHYLGVPWWNWPKEFASHNQRAIKAFQKRNKQNLLEHCLLQWHLFRQWNAIKSIASELGVLLFGDLPFYVSRDSSDVWSNRSLFSILPEGKLNSQSGVPPDYFSSTGQLWGTPVYQWSKHSETQFRWWRRRFIHHLNQVDLLRVDHFRAFESYWSVPGDKTTAEEGFWQPAPGAELLRLLQNDLEGELPLVAEDLGTITKEVEELRDQFSLPGMKILQFAFDGNLQNPYLPENMHGNNWVVYTGTHDNSTTQGWWDELDEKDKEHITDYLGQPLNSPVWQLLEMGLASKAKLVIAPLQDLLGLSNEARFNTPGTSGKNWRWRLSSFDTHLENALSNYGKRGSHWDRTPILLD